MQWIEVSVPTRSDEIDDVCAQLAELGAGGMVVEDETDFQQFLEQNHQYWDYVDDALEAQFRGVSRIKFYLADDDDGRAQLAAIRAGIGRELVYAVDKDARYDEIWVIARRKERLEELRDKCTNPIRPIALDLSDLSSIDAYQALLEQEQPEIKMLVNAAGCGVFGPFAEADRKKLLASAQLNSLALTGMCHASLPYMHAGSSIINMGSNSAWQPVPYQAVYGASKSYVLSLSRAIGRELRPQGIHVMCVCPGWIKTEFQQVAHHDEYIRYVDKWYGPDEVAAQAMQDLKKKKSVSILGHPVRRQVRLVKLLPVDTVMDIWCKQQGIE